MTRSELIAALREAKGANVKLDGYVIEACGGVRNKNSIHPHRSFGRMPGDDSEGYYSLPNVTESLDAAVALVERVRPGWHWATATLPNNKAMAAIGNLADRGKEPPTVEAATPAIALLIALLESHDAKPEGK